MERMTILVGAEIASWACQSTMLELVVGGAGSLPVHQTRVDGRWSWQCLPVHLTRVGGRWSKQYSVHVMCHVSHVTTCQVVIHPLELADVSQ